MQINKYSIISFPIAYIILGYTVFAIKYTSPVGTPIQEVFVDKFLNSITHMWPVKLIIALVVAVIINLAGKRKMQT